MLPKRKSIPEVVAIDPTSTKAEEETTIRKDSVKRPPNEGSISHHKDNETTIEVDVNETVFLAEQEKVPLDPNTINKKHDIADSIFKSFRPILYLLQTFGRWPLVATKHPDGTREFEWNWRRPGSIYYIFVTFIVMYTLIVGTWSMVAIVIDVRIGPKGPRHMKKTIAFKYERTILERHLATFVMLWTSLIHCFIASVTFILRRKYMANYFTFWTKAMPIMQLDAAKGMFRWTMGMVLCYVGSIVTLVILSVSSVGPSVMSAPTLFGILMFREYLAPLYYLKVIEIDPTTTTLAPGVTTDHPTNTTPISLVKYELIETSAAGKRVINIVGGIFLLLVFSTSKVFMFVFIYKCKLLKNAFAQWNARAYASVLKGAQQMQGQDSRTTFTLLFRDHCLLLDLMDGTDQLFATILESYFALQVCSICFEGYFFIRTSRYGHDRPASIQNDYFIRPYDWLPAVLIFAQSVSLLIMVSYSAAAVGEEAMAGFEVLRRRSLMGRKTNDELYFMLTMFASYTAYKRIELSAGGYFYLNKEFLIGVTSTILSYFIIIYQFQPKLDYNYDYLAKNSTKSFKRQILGKFLNTIEGSRYNYNYK